MKGKIYRIEYNEDPNIRYIGSTFSSLTKRLNQHKTAKVECSITKYFKEFGFKSFSIILIKEYEVIDKYHLKVYEQLWMNKIINININSAFIIPKITNKSYYIKNNNIIKEKSVIYRENNREILRERYKKANIKREEERKERIYCEYCKYDFVKRELKRHERSSRHQKNILN